MKYTQVASDIMQKFQLNPGVILSEFDPTSGTLDKTKILAATSGGTQFQATPEYEDYGEDIDNLPPNTKELKVLKSMSAVLSGTGKTVDPDFAKMLIGAATSTATGGVTKIVPLADLASEHFHDMWWVGDYSDHNGDTNGGFLAIHVLNTISTGGFQLQSNDGKADFAFEFTGHYSIEDVSVLPFELYIKPGTAE